MFTKNKAMAILFTESPVWGRSRERDWIVAKRKPCQSGRTGESGQGASGERGIQIPKPGETGRTLIKCWKSGLKPEGLGKNIAALKRRSSTGHLPLTTSH